MVDVSGKAPTVREAVAAGSIRMSAPAYRAVRRGTLAKGNVAAVARVAAIGAAKRTSDLIPLCHPVPLEHLGVEIGWNDRTREVRVEATARARWSTGVEMEALVAVAAALLTIYDMAKGIDRGMTIGPMHLLRKSGGRSGVFVRRPD
jgi:cyclic pyranopterin phosphate synthase